MPSDIIKVTRAFLRHVTENAVCEEDKALRAALDALPGNVFRYIVTHEDGGGSVPVDKETALLVQENWPGSRVVALLAVPAEDIEEGRDGK